jgi:hypothetical protein
MAGKNSKAVFRRAGQQERFGSGNCGAIICWVEQGELRGREWSRDDGEAETIKGKRPQIGLFRRGARLNGCSSISVATFMTRLDREAKREWEPRLSRYNVLVHGGLQWRYLLPGGLETCAAQGSISYRADATRLHAVASLVEVCPWPACPAWCVFSAKGRKVGNLSRSKWPLSSHAILPSTWNQYITHLFSIRPLTG